MAAHDDDVYQETEHRDVHDNITKVARGYHGYWLPGQSANPAGRPPSPKPKRQSPTDILAASGINIFADKLAWCQKLKAKLDDPHLLTSELMELGRQYSEALRDLLQYAYPRLKAIDHTVTHEVLTRLDELEGMSDDDLQAVLNDAKGLLHGDKS